MVEYDARQVRNVLKDMLCNEIIPGDDNIRYFQNSKGMAQLHMNEPVDDLQIDIICENIKIDCEEFRALLRKDKKHKK